MPDSDSDSDSDSHPPRPRTGLAALTPRQRRVFDVIRDHVRLHGRAPTVREMAADLGCKSVNALHKHVLALIRKRVVARDGRQARALRVLVPEAPRAHVDGAAVVLDCGDRVYHLSRPAARALAVTLLDLTVPAARRHALMVAAGDVLAAG